MSPSRDTTDSEGAAINRRDVLKTIGAGAGAVVVATGTASATRNKFYGCSQVCADSKGIEAVVATDDGFACREMNRTSNRGDVPWDYDSHCYEVSDGEAIVGVVEACHFCENPNNCASNHYDSVESVLDDIEGSCSKCTEIDPDGDCGVIGNGNGNNGNGNGNNGNGNNGNGNGNGNNGNGNGNGN
jgi:hypothetical protein